MSKPKTAKKKLSFSKIVVVAYFFVLVGLALAMVALAYISIQKNYLGSLSNRGKKTRRAASPTNPRSRTISQWTRQKTNLFDGGILNEILLEYFCD